MKYKKESMLQAFFLVVALLCGIFLKADGPGKSDPYPFVSGQIVMATRFTFDFGFEVFHSNCESNTNTITYYSWRSGQDHACGYPVLGDHNLSGVHLFPVSSPNGMVFRETAVAQVLKIYAIANNCNHHGAYNYGNDNYRSDWQNITWNDASIQPSFAEIQAKFVNSEWLSYFPGFNIFFPVYLCTRAETKVGRLPSTTPGVYWSDYPFWIYNELRCNAGDPAPGLTAPTCDNPDYRAVTNLFVGMVNPNPGPLDVTVYAA